MFYATIELYAQKIEMSTKTIFIFCATCIAIRHYFTLCPLLLVPNENYFFHFLVNVQEIGVNFLVTIVILL